MSDSDERIVVSLDLDIGEAEQQLRDFRTSFNELRQSFSDAPHMASAFNQGVDRAIDSVDLLTRKIERARDTGSLDEESFTRDVSAGLRELSVIKQLFSTTGSFSTEIAANMFGGLSDAVKRELDANVTAISTMIRTKLGSLRSTSIGGMARELMETADAQQIFRKFRSTDSATYRGVIQALIPRVAPTYMLADYKEARYGTTNTGSSRFTPIEVIPSSFVNSYKSGRYIGSTGSFDGPRYMQADQRKIIRDLIMENDAALRAAQATENMIHYRNNGQATFARNITPEMYEAFRKNLYDDFIRRSSGMASRRIDPYGDLSADEQRKLASRMVSSSAGRALAAMDAINGIQGDNIWRDSRLGIHYEPLAKVAKRSLEQYEIAKFRFDDLFNGTGKRSNVTISESPNTRILGLQGHHNEFSDKVILISGAGYNKNDEGQQRFIEQLLSGAPVNIPGTGKSYIMQNMHGTGEHAVIRMVEAEAYEKVRREDAEWARQNGFAGTNFWNDFIDEVLDFKNIRDLRKHYDATGKGWTPGYAINNNMRGKSFGVVDFSRMDEGTKKKFADGLGWFMEGILPTEDFQGRAGVAVKGTFHELTGFRTIGEWAVANGLANAEGRFILPGPRGDVDLTDLHGMIDVSTIKNLQAYENFQTSEAFNEGFTKLLQRYGLSVVSTYDDSETRAKGLGAQAMAFVKLSPQMQEQQINEYTRRMRLLDTEAGIREYILGDPENPLGKRVRDGQLTVASSAVQAWVQGERQSLMERIASGEWLDFGEQASVINQKLNKSPVAAILGLNTNGTQAELLQSIRERYKERTGKTLNLSDEDLSGVFALGEHQVVDFARPEELEVSLQRSPSLFGNFTYGRNYAQLAKRVYEEMGISTSGVYVSEADMKKLGGADFDGDAVKTLYGDIGAAIKEASQIHEAATQMLGNITSPKTSAVDLGDVSSFADTPAHRRLAFEANMAQVLAMGSASSAGMRAMQFDISNPLNRDYLIAAIQSNTAYEDVTAGAKNATETELTDPMWKALRAGAQWSRLPTRYSRLFNVTGQNDLEIPNPEDIATIHVGDRDVQINLAELRNLEFDKINLRSAASGADIGGMLGAMAVAQQGGVDMTREYALLEALDKHIGYGNAGERTRALMQNMRTLKVFDMVNPSMLTEEQLVMMDEMVQDARKEIEEQAFQKTHGGDITLEDGTTLSHNKYVERLQKEYGVAAAENYLHRGITQKHLLSIYGDQARESFPQLFEEVQGIELPNAPLRIEQQQAQQREIEQLQQQRERIRQQREQLQRESEQQREGYRPEPPYRAESEREEGRYRPEVNDARIEINDAQIEVSGTHTEVNGVQTDSNRVQTETYNAQIEQLAQEESRLDQEIEERTRQLNESTDPAKKFYDFVRAQEEYTQLIGGIDQFSKGLWSRVQKEEAQLAGKTNSEIYLERNTSMADSYVRKLTRFMGTEAYAKMSDQQQQHIHQLIGNGKNSLHALVAEDFADSGVLRTQKLVEDLTKATDKSTGVWDAQQAKLDAYIERIKEAQFVRDKLLEMSESEENVSIADKLKEDAATIDTSIGNAQKKYDELFESIRKNNADNMQKQITNLEKQLNPDPNRNRALSEQYQERIQGIREQLEGLHDKNLIDDSLFKGLISQLDELEKKSSEAALTAKGAWNAFGNVATRVLMQFGRRVLRQAIQEIKKFVTEFDSQMTTIQMITLKSDKEISELGKNIIQTAIDLKTSVSEVASATAALYRQGLSDEEVEERREDVIKFASVTGMKTEEATKIITTAMQNGLVETSQEAMDALTALGDSAATTASEIAKGMQKSAAAAKEAGVSYAELVTLLTIGTSKTQLGGSNVGSALQTLMYRLYKVGANEDFYDENGNHVANTAATKALAKMGISLFDQSGSFKGAYSILTEIASGWENADDVTRSMILSTLGAGRQRSNIATLIQGLAEDDGELADKYLKLAEGSAGITDEKHEERLKSLQAAVDTLKSSFDQLINTVNGAQLASGFFDIISYVLQGISQINEGLGGLLVLLPLLGIAAVGIFAAVDKALMAHPVVAGIFLAITGVTVAVGAISKAISDANQAAIANSPENKQRQRDAENKEKYDKYLSTSRTVKSNYEDLINETKELIAQREELEKLGQTMDDAASAKLENNIQTLITLFPSLKDKISDTTDELAKWKLIAEGASDALNDIESFSYAYMQAQSKQQYERIDRELAEKITDEIPKTVEKAALIDDIAYNKQVDTPQNSIIQSNLGITQSTFRRLTFSGEMGSGNGVLFLPVAQEEAQFLQALINNDQENLTELFESNPEVFEKYGFKSVPQIDDIMTYLQEITSIEPYSQSTANLDIVSWLIDANNQNKYFDTTNSAYDSVLYPILKRFAQANNVSDISAHSVPLKVEHYKEGYAASHRLDFVNEFKEAYEIYGENRNDLKENFPSWEELLMIALTDPDAEAYLKSIGIISNNIDPIAGSEKKSRFINNHLLLLQSLLDIIPVDANGNLLYNIADENLKYDFNEIINRYTDVINAINEDAKKAPYDANTVRDNASNLISFLKVMSTSSGYTIHPVSIEGEVPNLLNSLVESAVMSEDRYVLGLLRREKINYDQDKTNMYLNKESSTFYRDFRGNVYESSIFEESALDYIYDYYDAEDVEDKAYNYDPFNAGIAKQIILNHQKIGDNIMYNKIVDEDYKQTRTMYGQILGAISYDENLWGILATKILQTGINLYDLYDNTDAFVEDYNNGWSKLHEAFGNDEQGFDKAISIITEEATSFKDSDKYDLYINPYLERYVEQFNDAYEQAVQEYINYSPDVLMDSTIKDNETLKNAIMANIFANQAEQTKNEGVLSWLNKDMLPQLISKEIEKVKQLGENEYYQSNEAGQQTLAFQYTDDVDGQTYYYKDESEFRAAVGRGEVSAEVYKRYANKAGKDAFGAINAGLSAYEEANNDKLIANRFYEAIMSDSSINSIQDVIDNLTFGSLENFKSFVSTNGDLAYLLNQFATIDEEGNKIIDTTPEAFSEFMMSLASLSTLYTDLSKLTLRKQSINASDYLKDKTTAYYDDFKAVVGDSLAAKYLQGQEAFTDLEQSYVDTLIANARYGRQGLTNIQSYNKAKNIIGEIRKGTFDFAQDESMMSALTSGVSGLADYVAMSEVIKNAGLDQTNEEDYEEISDALSNAGYNANYFYYVQSQLDKEMASQSITLMRNYGDRTEAVASIVGNLAGSISDVNAQMKSMNQVFNESANNKNYRDLWKAGVRTADVRSNIANMFGIDVKTLDTKNEQWVNRMLDRLEEEDLTNMQTQLDGFAESFGEVKDSLENPLDVFSGEELSVDEAIETLDGYLTESQELILQQVGNLDVPVTATIIVTDGAIKLSFKPEQVGEETIKTIENYISEGVKDYKIKNEDVLNMDNLYRNVAGNTEIKDFASFMSAYGDSPEFMSALNAYPDLSYYIDKNLKDADGNYITDSNAYIAFIQKLASMTSLYTDQANMDYMQQAIFADAYINSGLLHNGKNDLYSDALRTLVGDSLARKYEGINTKTTSLEDQYVQQLINNGKIGIEGLTDMQRLAGAKQILDAIKSDNFNFNQDSNMINAYMSGFSDFEEYANLAAQGIDNLGNQTERFNQLQENLDNELRNQSITAMQSFGKSTEEVVSIINSMVVSIKEAHDQMMSFNQTLNSFANNQYYRDLWNAGVRDSDTKNAIASMLGISVEDLDRRSVQWVNSMLGSSQQNELYDVQTYLDAIAFILNTYGIDTKEYKNAFNNLGFLKEYGYDIETMFDENGNVSFKANMPTADTSFFGLFGRGLQAYNISNNDRFIAEQVYSSIVSDQTLSGLEDNKKLQYLIDSGLLTPIANNEAFAGELQKFVGADGQVINDSIEAYASIISFIAGMTGAFSSDAVKTMIQQAQAAMDAINDPNLNNESLGFEELKTIVGENIANKYANQNGTNPVTDFEKAYAETLIGNAMLGINGLTEDQRLNLFQQMLGQMSSGEFDYTTDEGVINTLSSGFSNFSAYYGAANVLSNEGYSIDQFMGLDKSISEGFIDFESLEEYERISKILEDAGYSVKQFVENQKQLDKELAGSAIISTKKYGDETENVVSILNNLKGSARDVTNQMKSFNQTLTSTLNNQFFRNKWRSGDRTQETKEAIANMIGVDTNYLDKMSDALIEDMLQSIENIDKTDVQTMADAMSNLMSDTLTDQIGQDTITLKGNDINVTSGSVTMDLSEAHQELANILTAEQLNFIEQLEAAGIDASVVVSGNNDKIQLQFVVNSLGSGYKGNSGGGGGGSKSAAEKLIEEQKRKATLRDHLIKMIQYQQEWYKDDDQLGNYGKMIELENAVREQMKPTLENNLQELRNQLGQTEKNSDDWYTLRDAVLSAEEAIEENNKAIADNTRKLKENEQAILKLHTELEDLLANEIKTRIQEQRDMVSGTASMEDQIYNIIQESYRKQWELIKKDIDIKKQALQEEMTLIDKRLQARKEAEEQAAEYEELRELQKQLAIISMDPTRTKDAAELRKKISDLQNKLAWGVTEENAEAAKEELQEQIDAYDQFESEGDEALENFLKDANNFADKITKLLESSYEELIQWLKDNSDEYKNSLDATQENMINSWTDTWKQMKGIVDTFWEEIAGILSSEETFIEYMKQSSTYINASEDERKQLEYTWREMYQKWIKAQDTSATYEHSDADLELSGYTNDTYTPPTNPTQKPSTSFYKFPRKIPEINNLSVVETSTTLISTDSNKSIAERLKDSLNPVKDDLVRSLIGFDTGGVASNSGLAVVHNKERVLTEQQNRVFEAMLDMFNYVRIPSFVDYLSGDNDRYNHTIDHLSVEINGAKFETDADYQEIARRVGEALAQELEEQGFSTAKYAF